MNDRSLSRRTLLKHGGVAIAAGTGVGAAGCSSIPIVGGGGDGPSLDRYTKWLYPTDAVNWNDYGFSLRKPAEIEANEDHYDEDRFEYLERKFERHSNGTGLDMDEVDWLLELPVVTVIEGSFEQSDVVEELQDEGMTADNDYAGYRTYTTDDSAAAIDDGTLVLAGDSDDADSSTVLHATLDASEGNSDRYLDENETLGVLLDTVRDATMFNVIPWNWDSEWDPLSRFFENSIGHSNWTDVRGEQSKLQLVIAFDDESQVDTDEIQEWADDNEGRGGLLPRWDDTKVTQDGRLAVLESTVDTDDL